MAEVFHPPAGAGPAALTFCNSLEVKPLMDLDRT